MSYSDFVFMPGLIDFPTSDVDLSGNLVKDGSIRLKTPFISSPMDTVTESDMAISMALMGGIGLIHCNNTIEDQCEHVGRVKRYCNGFIYDPVSVPSHWNVSQVLELQATLHFTGYPVVSEDNTLLGMISRRDVDLIENPSETSVKDAMTPLEKLVTAPDGHTLDEVHKIIKREGISRLPIIDANGKLKALVCRKDIRELRVHPIATRDQKTQKLLVGATVTTHPRDRERISRLVASEVDVICLDSAQGSSSYQLETLKYIKSEYPNIPVICGNVVTSEQAKLLINGGADCLRVGQGVGIFFVDIFFSLRLI